MECVYSLVSVLDDALAPLDSLADILASGGHEDVAVVGAGLLRDAHARLHSVARCLEAGCGRELMLRNMGGMLSPVPYGLRDGRCARCPCAQETDSPAI